MDDKEKAILAAGTLVLGAAAMKLFGFLDRPRKDGGQGPPKKKSKARPSRPEAEPQPPRPVGGTDPAVALVISARHGEVIEELRQCSLRGDGPGQDLAHKLNEAAWGLWYGSARDDNFARLEALVREAEAGAPVNESLDFVVCLFHLWRPNRNLETGAIGRRYDGIMELSAPGLVRRIEVSEPVSVTALGDVTVARI